MACQFHPELISRPNRPQRLIKGFVGAALANKESNKQNGRSDSVHFVHFNLKYGAHDEPRTFMLLYFHLV